MTPSRAMRALATVALITSFTACGDFSTTPVSLGRVTVSVRDQNGTGMPLVAVDLIVPGSATIWQTIRTGSDGTGEFGEADGGVKAQSYIVRVTPPATYTLAPGEANDKPVTAVMGQAQQVDFRLEKGSAVGLPQG